MAGANWILSIVSTDNCIISFSISILRHGVNQICSAWTRPNSRIGPRCLSQHSVNVSHASKSGSDKGRGTGGSTEIGACFGLRQAKGAKRKAQLQPSQRATEQAIKNLKVQPICVANTAVVTHLETIGISTAETCLMPIAWPQGRRYLELK